MKPGIIIQSTPLLQGTYFEDTVIYITEYNSKGAAGFIVNRPFPRKFNELEEFKYSIPFPLYEGGPVDKEHLFCIHNQPVLINGSIPVAGDICVGGDFKQAVRLINNHSISSQHIRLFIGYCGWDKGELEAEIEEGSWMILPAGGNDVTTIFLKY